MRPFALTVCLMLLLIAYALGSDGESDSGKPAEALRFVHASLDAYPNAVISLKDPKTGMTFYVESDGRRLIALDRDGVVAWGVDLLEEIGAKPLVGKPVVRHLRLDGDRLWATCGRSDAATIDVKSGRVHYAGRD